MPSVYVSLSTVDRWLDNDRIELTGDAFRLRAKEEGARTEWSFLTTPAVLFEALDDEGVDAHALLGTVRSLPALAEIGGEHAEDTAVVGNETYTVKPGMIAVPMGPDGGEFEPDSPTWAAMVRALDG